MIFIWLIGLIIAWPLLARKIKGLLIEEHPTLEWAVMDEAMAILIGFIFAMAWPLVLVAAFVIAPLVKFKVMERIKK